jgi:hypothetical protein
MTITAQQIRALVAQHGTIFFDKNLKPITPKAGQWFCEFDDELDGGESGELWGEALVEYVGPQNPMYLDSSGREYPAITDPKRRHLVSADGQEWDVREPYGYFLMLQA